MKRIVTICTTLALVAFMQLGAIAQAFDTPPRDGFYENVNLTNKKPIPYAPVRQADVMWSKRIWRVIDLREKMNLPFYYPLSPHDNWRSFMTIVIDALKEGTITAYDVTNTDEFTVPITWRELNSRLSPEVRKTLQRPYPPYDSYDTVIKSEFAPSDVTQLRIKEDWFFDKQRSQLDVRIIGICPVVNDYDDKGEERGKKPLFWIYYPDARTIFAQAEIFNRHNDAERMSYDEIFMKRMFNSYIIKENNVYDRKIIDYLKGEAAMLESERIKNDIFDFESNLWEF